PLLHEVIPIMDGINQYLVQIAKDDMNLPVIQDSTRCGLVIADKYYAKTDDSAMYRAAMIMHPRYIMSYFDDENWPEEWKTSAKATLKHLYNTYYKPSSSLEGSDNNDEELDPLKEWIDKSPVTTKHGDNPLKYWGTLAVDGDMLARMALDILSCPATFTDIEQGFSRGSLTVTPRCHNLSADTIQKLMAVAAW
ncbi:hypothetical protein K435DRAFT_566147, partial [Dendrothele bispora CBS 962.96]